MIIGTTISTTGTSSDAVSRDLLGSNTLFHRDEVHQGSLLDQITSLAHVTYLRYPGGTITEEYFDLADPNSDQNTNIVEVISGDPSPTTRDLTPLDAFLDFCEVEGIAPVIVLPTYRYFDQSTRMLDPSAETEIKDFVKDLLTGEYGDVDIRAFELGNEWYQDRFNWTTQEFADFQADLAEWVSEAIDDVAPSDRPQVFAQAGQTTAQNTILADAFDGSAADDLDGVITHLYGTNGAGNPLGIGGGIANRLSDISDIWSDVSESLDLAVTEWNVGESGEATTLINGIMRSAPLLRIFAEMVRADVDLAAIWTANAPGPAALGTESNGQAALTPTGYLFQLLAANLNGLSLQELDGGDRLRDSSNAVVGYKYLFASDTQNVLYFASGVDDELEVTANVDLDIPTDTYVYATILGAAPGEDGTQYDSMASYTLLTDLDIQLDQNGIPEFSHTLNPYEVIQYHFVSGEGVSLRADAQNDIRDNLIGTKYDDTISAFGGNDTLRGNDGDDALLGGQGRDRLYGGHGKDTLRGDDGDDTIYGGVHDDALVGSFGDDDLYGEDGKDRLWGGGGKDTMRGGDGADFLEGGDLDDLLSGNDGADDIYGENGSDRMFGGDENDTLRGGEGDDTIYGDRHDDALIGSSGDDDLHGEHGKDRLWGGGGRDTLRGGDGADFLEGGDLDDLLSGNDGADDIYGENGADRMFGGDENDTLRGGEGDDAIFGGNDDDALIGSAGDDDLDGEAGSDRLWGGGGKDTLRGGDGADVLQGGNQDDVLAGNNGDDDLFGQDGADRLFGGAGDDTLSGGEGIDSLEGSVGDDQMRGGSGADTFVFANGHGHDTIVDFSEFNGAERIDLRGVTAITSFNDLDNNHMTQSGANVVISAGSGQSITLEGVAVSALDASDFIF